MKTLKTLETVTGLDKLGKEYLAKSTPTDPNKEQIVFVLIHQKTGFVNVTLHHTLHIEFLMKQWKPCDPLGPKC